MAKKKVLVTGAGGFIGSHLCEALAGRGFKVRAFLRYNSVNSWGWLEQSGAKNNMEILSGDIRDYDSVRKAVKGIDSVFHLAALISIPYSYETQQAFVDVNVNGALNLLQASLEEGVKKFIHTSTSEVYGTAQQIPINESHPINPQSPYAATKIGADFLALSFYKSFNLPVAVIRPFNTYGPRQSARAIIPNIISQIVGGNKNIKLGSLYPKRDFTFVKDTVYGFMRIAESKKSIGEVINIGNNSDIAIGNLVKLIARLMRVKIKVDSQEKRIRPPKSEVARLLADNSKAKNLVGWKPKYSLEEGLLETIEWFKTHNQLYKTSIYNV